MLNSSHSAVLFLVIAMVFASFSSAQNQQPCSKGTLEDFAWFTGHWISDANGSHIDEYWSAPMGGVLPGMIRAGNSEKTSFLEFFTVRETADGIDLSVRHFSADLTPAEKDKALVFRLKCLSKEVITFENTGEGQPRTLLMERPGPDTFRARNEVVTKDGAVRKVDITFTRISR